MPLLRFACNVPHEADERERHRSPPSPCFVRRRGLMLFVVSSLMTAERDVHDEVAQIEVVPRQHCTTSGSTARVRARLRRENLPRLSSRTNRDDLFRRKKALRAGAAPRVLSTSPSLYLRWRLSALVRSGY